MSIIVIVDIGGAEHDFAFVRPLLQEFDFSQDLHNDSRKHHCRQGHVGYRSRLFSLVSKLISCVFLQGSFLDCLSTTRYLETGELLYTVFARCF